MRANESANLQQPRVKNHEYKASTLPKRGGRAVQRGLGSLCVLKVIRVDAFEG